MEKGELKILSDALGSMDKLRSEGEDGFISFIRAAVLRKNEVELSTYTDFLKKHLEDLNEGFKEYIPFEDMAKNKINDLDMTSLCSILEEHMSQEKRELTGSYYTPVYIIEYIFLSSIMLYFQQNTGLERYAIKNLIYFEDASSITKDRLHELLKVLNKIRIIDIACGTGLFLHHIFDKLLNIRKLIYKEINIEFDEYYERKFILENNIFGVDIQYGPIEMILLKYIDMLSNYEDFNIDFLKMNFYQRNSILGNGIFTVSKIKEVMDEGGFDIVIGNPPYIGEKGNKSIFEDIRKHEFGKKYYEAKMDYFYYFIYRGIDMLRKEGILSYITTNYFITADGARLLRKFLKERVSFRNIVNFNEYEIFKAAKGQHNMIFTLTKGKKDDASVDVSYINNYKLKTNEIILGINNKRVNNKGISNYSLDNQSELYSDKGNIMIFPKQKYSEIVKKIKVLCNFSLRDICNINQGIVSGADKVTKGMLRKKFKEDTLEKYNIVPDKGIFVLNKEEILANGIENCKLLKPFYKNSDIRKYSTDSRTDKYILYLTDKNTVNLEDCNVKNHLLKYKDVLDLRRETQKGIRKWSSLQWSREQSIFEGPKIVVPQRAVRNRFAYNEGMWYASADVYFITARDKNIDLKLLLGILNSKITYFWLYNMGKRKGNYLELYSTPLGDIPINLNLDYRIAKEVVDAVNKILLICQNEYTPTAFEKYQGRIDEALYRAYNFTKEEIDIINEVYPN